MTDTANWVKHILTMLRKLDRQMQRAQLESILNDVDQAQHEALRQELEARRARVQAELKVYQTRRQQDAARTIRQKELMIARYNWLLHIIDNHAGPPSSTRRGDE